MSIWKNRSLTKGDGMITQFRVRNFKALRDVKLALTPFHILIGPNDSGKTSILEALAAVCRSVDMQLSQAFAGRWNGTELVWRNGRLVPVEFQLTAKDDESEFTYDLTFDFPVDGKSVQVKRESVGPLLDTKTVEFPPSYGGWTSIGYAAANHHTLGSQDRDEVARIVHDVFTGVQIYRWDSRFLALPNAPDASRRFRMEPSGFGLALCLDDILGYDRKLFERLENRFKTIFPDIETIRLMPEPAFAAPTDASVEVPVLQRKDGKGIYFQFSGGGPLVPASQVSDGVLLILAYLAVLHLPQPPRLLLVEEPENGIHPARLKEVLSILRDLVAEQSHTQVVMTTHSPYVVDSFQPDEVTL